MSETIKIKCCGCDTEAERPKAKDGSASLKGAAHWKFYGDAYYCRKCWHREFRVLAITMTVSGTLNENGEPHGDKDAAGEARKRFNHNLSWAWHQSGLAANWLVTQLAAAEDLSLWEFESDENGYPHLKKGGMPPLPKINGYKIVTEMGIDPNSATALQQTVSKRYAKERFEIFVRRTRSLSNFRNLPYPLPKNGLKLRWLDEDNKTVVLRCRINRQIAWLKLFRKENFRQQKGIIASWIKDPLLLSQCAIYREEKHGRPGQSRKAAGGGNEYTTKTVVKLVGWVRKKARQARENILVVSFPADSFLTAVVEGREDPWRYHNDHIGRRIGAHQKRLARLSDDQKFERRRRTRDRQPINDYREIAVKKMQRVLDSFIHESTAHLANFAARHQVSQVIAEGEPRCFPRFPCFQWMEKLQYKLNALGIDLIRRQPPDPTEKEANV